MISKKKGDTSQIFTYISTAIVIIVVLGFGVHWISGLLRNVSDIECIQFKRDLELRVRNNLDYGKIDTRPLRVDCDYREICFISDPLSFDETYHSDGTALSSIINSTYAGNVPQNVFFNNHIPESFYYIEKLSVEGNKLCFNITRLGLEFQLEGMGSHVLLTRS